MEHPDCPLCRDPGGLLVASAPRWRVIRAAEPDFPAFYRVIWQDHAAEFSDLSPTDREACMAVVIAVEQVLRQALTPTKINLATLGNVVPHLHWHVIARFDWDSHFPNPVWGERRQTLDTEAATRLAVALPELDARVREAVAALA
ncbi:Diadenosine tetraphosphate (Ap4A) hydrolase [Roseateles sp. YR242]|uniref:HIT family protein n=1 Tax=Roseateles sp. YR242 TaxID=1855305 RepID=UPI0008B8222D|nr:HIT family protein [Roseateles sp. YR242]SEK98692.1 Diadenosine tetraphosphate (Ap4A) hydrolase [Roseateles sp. YR242]